MYKLLKHAISTHMALALILILVAVMNIVLMLHILGFNISLPQLNGISHAISSARQQISSIVEALKLASSIDPGLVDLLVKLFVLIVVLIALEIAISIVVRRKR